MVVWVRTQREALVCLVVVCTSLMVLREMESSYSARVTRSWMASALLTVMSWVRTVLVRVLARLVPRVRRWERVVETSLASEVRVAV